VWDEAKSEAEGERTRHVGTGGEESTLAGDDGESGVGMVVEFSQGGDGVFDEAASERIELLGAVELVVGASVYEWFH
jgi:hypothetical protein